MIAVAGALAGAIFDFGDIPGVDGNPGTLPRLYGLLECQRMPLEALHASRLATRSAWRVTARSVGSTADEARWVAKQFASAFDSARLTIEGFESTPLFHEETEAVARFGSGTDRWFEGQSSWSYCL